MEYRDRNDGAILDYQGLIEARPQTYIPALPTAEYLAAIDVDVVQEVVPQAPVNTDAVRDGVEQVDGQWRQVWKFVAWSVERINEAAAQLRAQAVDAMNAYLVEVRDMRERLLNRLAGIGAAAIVSGDTETQQAFVQARQRLLDITKIPDALAAYQAGDLVALEAAVKKEYAAIVADAPPSLTKAFDEVDA